MGKVVADAYGAGLGVRRHTLHYYLGNFFQKVAKIAKKYKK